MLTLATVDADLSGMPADEATIYVDIDDNGFAYIKQGDDWIAFPVKQTHEVIAALNQIWRD